MNPYHVIGLFLYPLKTSKNQKLSDVLGGIERDQSHEMGYRDVLLEDTFVVIVICSSYFYLSGKIISYTVRIFYKNFCQKMLEFKMFIVKSSQKITLKL